MKKAILYIISILALGIVIFNNFIQTTETVIQNKDYLIALLLSSIGAIVYGIVNLK